MREGDEDEAARRAAASLVGGLARRLEPLSRRQRPYGLAPGPGQPAPAVISAEAFGVTPRAVLAFVSRSPVPRSSLALRYGADQDSSAVLVEVLTDFSRGHEDSGSLGYRLWRAADRYPAARPDSATDAGLPAGPDDSDEDTPPFAEGTASFLADGAPRQVPALTYRQYQAFRFRDGPDLVTVITRHQAPEPFSLSRISDLSGYAAEIGDP